jgi:hypothetical protein
MAVPTLFGSSSFAASTTARSGVAWPAGHAVDDLAIAFCWRSGEQADAVPTGFTLLGTVVDIADATGMRLSVYYRWATSTAESSVSFADTGDHQGAGFHVFRGVDPGATIEFASDTLTTASTSATIPSVTTLVADSLVIVAVGVPFNTGTAVDGWTNGNLANFAEVTDSGTTAGNDGRVAIAIGEKATAGATGTTSATVATAATQVRVAIALAPPVTGGPTTYPQACYATASGAPTVTRGTSKVLSAAASGSATMGRNIAKTFAVAASGAVSSAQTLVTAVVQQCYAAGSATVSLAKRITKTLSVTATGAPTVVRKISKILTTAGAGAVSATQTLVTSVVQQCYATGSGAVTFARHAVLSVSSAVAATGAVSLSKRISIRLDAIGNATASLTRRISKRFTTTGTASVTATAGILLKQFVTAAGSGLVSSFQSFIAKGSIPDIVRGMLRNVGRTLVRLIQR